LRLLAAEIGAEGWVAAAALIISLSTVFTQCYFAIRGPVIETMPVESAIFYRDAGQSGDVLMLALRTTLINTASQDYGDVVKGAALNVPLSNGREIKFAYDGQVHPHFTADSALGSDSCEADATCVTLRGLKVIDRDERLVSLPGGSSRVDYLAFELSGPSCIGARSDCAMFSSFANAAHALSGRGLRLTIDLTFLKAARRNLRCTTGAINETYLNKVEWTNLECNEARDGSS
jgi:hypothetical protein